MAGGGKAISARDMQTLARLVGKYGRRAIVAAAQAVRHPPRAGRRREDENRAELWAHVEWIEERAGELREAGQARGAHRRATAERFLAVEPRERQTAAALRGFEKRIKTARGDYAKARRLMAAQRAAQLRNN